MTKSPLSIMALVDALALPPGEPPRRVPKSTLAENVPTAADRQLIETKLGRLEWLAAINPATTGIATGEADGLTIDTINLLAARTRGAVPPRLAEIIHRAIPKPVILFHRDETTETGAAMSLAAKRTAERELGHVVTTAVHDTGPLSLGDEPFLNELALSRLPTRNLNTLYVGLIERVEALTAAHCIGRPFRLADGRDEIARWRTALADIADHKAEIARLSALIRKEKRLAVKVELGETARQSKMRLDAAQAILK